MKNNKQKLLRVLGLSFLSSCLFLLPFLAKAATLSPDEIFSLINNERAANHLPQFHNNQSLAAAAKNKLDDMVAKNYFAHSSPEGLMPWDFMAGADYDYSLAGENLAQDYLSSEGVVKAWMASSTHRKNILNPDFQDTAIAIAASDHVTIVEFFGTLRNSVEANTPNVDKPAKEIIRPADESTSTLNVDPVITAELPGASDITLPIITNIRYSENYPTLTELLREFAAF